MAAGDKITEGVRIIAALAGVAQDPTLLSALKAGPGLLDSLKKIAARPPTSFARLGEDLGRSAAAIFAALPEKPPHAEMLYLQMVEEGLSDPAEIMAERMDAAAITEAMLARLTEPEHRAPEMQALFLALTQPTLERLLADKSFAAALNPAFMRAMLESQAKTERLLEEMRRDYGTLADALEGRGQLSRKRLEAIALRFGELEPEGLSEADLETFLASKAKDLRAAEAQLRALSDQGGRIANLKAAAEAAMTDLRLDAARDLIRTALSVHRSERTLRALREDADLVDVEAQILLLGNDADGAARLLDNAAGSFALFDPEEAVARRSGAQVKLYEHGLRYGGLGLARAIDLGRANVVAIDEAQNPVALAKAQNNLGAALRAEGERQGGLEGAALLGEAADVFSAALRVRTEAAHPMEWAKTQNNLGNALQTQGIRLGGPEGDALLGAAAEAYRAALRAWSKATHSVQSATAQNNLGAALWARGERMDGPKADVLLSEAVAACRAALGVRTEAAYPVDWAGAKNNLGNAFQAQAERLVGPEGDVLLGAAVDAYRAALRVRTEAVYPTDWATTQNNLGIALRAKGERLDGPEGAALLGEAVAACRAAFRVRSEAAHPADWAMTQNNMGNTLRTQGVRLGGLEGAALIGEAVVACRAALRVRTEVAHPVAWARTTENLGLANEDLADNVACADPRAALQVAETCFIATLRVYDAETMPYYYTAAKSSLARVRAKLAALPDPA